MGWQPIETAPKDGTDVLLYLQVLVDGEHPTTAIEIGYWCDYQHWIHETDGIPTHWIFLPEPPK